MIQIKVPIAPGAYAPLPAAHSCKRWALALLASEVRHGVGSSVVRHLVSTVPISTSRTGHTTAPDGQSVTVDNCAREPIHIPGLIQPHGALVAFDAATSIILHASSNLQEWLPAGTLLLKGRPLRSLVDRDSWERVDHAVRAPGTSSVRHAIVALQFGNPGGGPPISLQGLVHRHGGQCILELEKPAEHEDDWMQAHADVMSLLRGALDLDDLLTRLTAQVKAFCGFDRVMVYRFYEDWHGEVVAESCEPGMEPFLRLHFPASDIPAQARELYHSNLVRYVPTADYEPVPVLPWLDVAGEQPLDMSHATLRSVSPIHLQYLRNMGVQSTLTLSIMVEGKLWGLVACHHRRKTELPLRMRQTCAALAIGSGHLVAWQSQRHGVDALHQASVLQSRIVAAFDQMETPLAEVVAAAATPLLRLAGATAGALWHGNELIEFGCWPSGDSGRRIIEFAARALQASAEDVLAFDSLPPSSPLQPADLEAVSGCMIARLGEFTDSALVWLRPEHRQEVAWGGNPDKPVTMTDSAAGGTVLSPRASFERWATLVRGKCRGWTGADTDAARLMLPLRQLLAARDSLANVQESHRRFRALVELQSDAYWQLDVAGRVVTLSKALPFAIETVHGKRLTELFEPFCRAETMSDMRCALASGNSFRDLRLSSKSADESGEFELLLSGDPLRDHHFKLVGFHGTLTDVTQALKAGKALRLREAAEQSNKAKSTFLSHVSHELRTPLNAVLGFSQLLLDDDTASATQRKRAASIHSAGQWLFWMISDLLDVARIEAGSPKIDLRPTLAGPLILEAIGYLQHEADAMAVLVGFEPARTEARVIADPMRLKQVLVNLISNAIKYNRREGTVSIAVAPVDAKGFVAVSVRDSGSGLDADQLRHLFEPFNRLGREGKGIQGSGIGLVIAKQFAEAMGGRIEASSGQALPGSCFTVFLRTAEYADRLDGPPAAARPAPPNPAALNLIAPRPSPAITRASKAGVVLYVEDDPTNAELMKAIVESGTTARIAVAGTAEEGLAMARELRPDLMLIDINLPGKDGAWLLRTARQEPALKDTFCIAVTADALQETLFALRLHGFDQCWHKPVDPRWSGRVIQAVLDATALDDTLIRLGFADPQAFAALTSAADPWLDTLDFGVIRLDDRNRVTAYNLRESLLSGYEPASVMGRDFFKEVGVCMNNPQVAARFESAGDLDAMVETFFKVRLRKVPVKLRLLKGAREPERYILVDRLDGLADS